MAALDDTGGWQVLLGKVASSTSLSQDEAAGAMAEILSGAATDAQIAGLIVGLRIKGETADEMTGLVTAMIEAAEPLNLPPSAIDIVGTGGSAHRRVHALNISTMASVVAAAAGAVVCKHGNRRASSTSGSSDFLEAMGIDIGLTPAGLETCVAKIGVGFAFAKTFHPAMRHVGPVRAELGIPTVFNVLGPLAHPGRVTHQVLGTASVELAATMAQVLQNLGSKRSWVISGHGGLDEMTTTGPTSVFEVTPEGVTRFEVTPQEAGIEPAPSLEALAGGSPSENASIFAAIADGSERGPRRDVVVFNAAAGLVVAGVAADLAEGVSAAERALDDGRVADKVADLVAVTGRSEP
jgi:anthranilate phosphoribosyltransferase